ncbi:MAG: hypothetical protein GY834_04580 [Bacteroidetes bacterium]|nr:hypothetical protein [Bacteroidota bacterium]
MPIAFNKVLIPPNIDRAFIKIETVGTRKAGSTRSRNIESDFSAVRFLIEELINLGALQLFLPSNSAFEKHLPALHPSLNERISIIDSNSKVIRQTKSFMRPITDELHMDIDKWTPTDILADEFRINAFSQGNKESRDLMMMVAYFADAIYTLLLGIKYKTQVDLSLTATKDAIANLRSLVKQPNSTSNLSIIGGIFSQYQNIELDSIKIAENIHLNELVKRFMSFLEDEEYRQLSREIHNIGYADKVKRSLIKAKRIATRIIEKKPFRQVLNITTKSLEAVINLPVPNSELSELLLSDNFLPPIIPLNIAILNARKHWMRDDQHWEPMNIEFPGETPFSSEYGVHKIEYLGEKLDENKANNKTYSVDQSLVEEYLNRIPLELWDDKTSTNSAFYRFGFLKPLTINPKEDVEELIAYAVCALFPQTPCPQCGKSTFTFNLSIMPLQEVSLMIEGACCNQLIKHIDSNILEKTKN